MRRMLVTTVLSSAMVMSSLDTLMAASTDLNTDDLLKLSLAELTNIQVTSVSKKAEKETEAAAAIFVITQEDIRRSGATAIPELLRMAPGITVTQAGAHDWTVTSRGFSKQFSNKLLVLIDGRTVYSPLFSGVIWDVQDTMLEDIERIEVIRGPGATLWGANAVNGVINIITKNSKDTQGGYASFAAGNQVKGIGSVRYGGKINDESYIRAYAKQTAYNSEFTATGDSSNDNWKKSQAGFRSDSTLSNGDKLTVQGDVYTIDEDANYLFPDLNSGTYTNRSEGTKAGGGNILARLEHSHSDQSQTTVQAYFDNNSYKTSFFNDLNNTVDIDIQNVWTGWNRHEFVWGAGYRFLNSQNDPASQQYSLSPKTRNDNLFNAFVQDKIALVDDKLFLTLGSKFEKNDYTGFEVQPSARIAWLAAEDQTLWASVSRAVHTPSRFTDNGYLSYTIIPPGGVPTLVQSAGNRSLDSEELIAYELGYRIQPSSSSSIDIATFYNDYQKLFRDALGTPIFPVFPGPYAIQPISTYNDNTAYSVGIEVAGRWNVCDGWQLVGSYSYIDLVFDNKSSPTFSDVGRQPSNQFNLTSDYRFSNHIEMTNSVYYVDKLSGVDIPAYYQVNTRISYEVLRGIELSLVGQNLLDDRHQEFTPFIYRYPAEIGRSIYGSAAFRF